MFLEAIFYITLFFILNIKLNILELEEEQNSKFKTMFNAIQDAVVVIKNESIKFINFYAGELIGGATDQMDTPFLYLFSDADENTVRRTIANEGEKLSVRDILAIDEEHLPLCVFTTSEEIAKCRQMDQVQRIIKDEQPENGLTTRFFSAKSLRIDGKDRYITKEGELMLQLQDISLRVYSQSLNIEKQYLTIMNSTVSHEMRNPLNAILSQIEKQEEIMAKLSAELQSLPLDT